MAYRLLVVGASWGGSRAVGSLLQALPPKLPLAIAIAQHRSADSPDNVLIPILSKHTQLPVSSVEDKDPVIPQHVYVAPAGYHLLLEDERFILSTEEPVRFSRPSIDVLFCSAADAYRSGAIGVVLTGANSDGAAGLVCIRRMGGIGLVQDPSTAEKPAMPQAAIEGGGAHLVLPIAEIAAFVASLCGVDPARRDRETTAARLGTAKLHRTM